MVHAAKSQNDANLQYKINLIAASVKIDDYKESKNRYLHSRIVYVPARLGMYKLTNTSDTIPYNVSN